MAFVVESPSTTWGYYIGGNEALEDAASFRDPGDRRGLSPVQQGVIAQVKPWPRTRRRSISTHPSEQPGG